MSLSCCYRSETNPDGCDFRRYRTSPLCQHHLFEIIRDAIYDDMLPPDILASLRVELAAAMAEQYRRGVVEIDELLAETAEIGKHDPVVYYVELTRNRIKIGTTRNLASRMRAMRCHLDDLLAVEPGDYDVEGERHDYFADSRLGTSEEFEDCERIRAWCAHLRTQHAELANLAKVGLVA